MTDVERGWFLRRWVQDFSPRYFSGTDPDRCFDEVDPAHARADIDTYQAAVEECRAAAADHDLDEQVPLQPGTKASPLIDVLWIYLHMIEEYARHNGHADLLRQTIDGSTGW